LEIVSTRHLEILCCFRFFALLTETAAPLTPESLVGLQTFQRALAIGYTGVMRR